MINATIDPACPMCDCIMWISVIEPTKPLYDKRTYICPRCDHVEVAIVQFREKTRRRLPTKNQQPEISPMP